MKRISLLLLVAAGFCSCGTGVGSQDSDLVAHQPEADTADPITQTINGFSTGGFEYWPYKEPPPLYPDKIQWGYEAGSDPARKCMADAHAALVKILQEPPDELVTLRDRFDVTSFYSWNNDLTGAAAGINASHKKIWLYEGSLIKWISETRRDGTCVIQERSDLVKFAKGCLDTPSSCGLSD